ncbi:hypothetical protein BDU57DRAFT_549177 [Ampelomyces quisqualis]|uniref:Uncharacterized protein n=1 Tax=Ampelomyces quisqualis TaxID=50730 RepID=A0A6A5QII3_AMPQU|nr:hypothetical protein BDU57DRAFT_549177 [Ampelomyces quisqualis]
MSSTSRAGSSHAIVGSTQPRSRIETLPTQLVEHNGPYIIHDKVGRYSIGALRVASKNAKARTDHTFRFCFTVKFVYFDMYSWIQLLLTSFSDTYSTSLRGLVFAEDARSTMLSHPKDNGTSQPTDDASLAHDGRFPGSLKLDDYQDRFEPAALIFIQYTSEQSRKTSAIDDPGRSDD